MKKIFFTVIVCFLFVVLSACTWQADKPAILFNHQPITERNVTDYSNTFSQGMRIYYLVLMPKTQNSRMLMLDVYKIGDGGRFGYSQYLSRTIRLKDEEMRYYTDYIVLNSKGSYIMEIKSYDNPQKTLAQGRFFVA